MSSNIKIKKINSEISSIIIDEQKTYNSLSFQNLNDLLKAFKKLDNDNLLLSDATVCKLELDLGKWLEQLTGRIGWEIWSESESEHYVSYHLKFKKQNAEITLYHSGHALVLIDEKPVFDGDLIEKRNPIAKLSYYNIDDGEKISLH